MAMILFSSDPSTKSLLVGVAPVAVGVCLRLLAVGFCQNSELVVAGPYRWVRYPHELGTSLVLIGLAMMGRQIDVILLICIAMALVFSYSVRAGDQKCAREAGEHLKRYQKLVPAFMPTLIPIGDHEGFQDFGSTQKVTMRAMLFGRRHSQVREIEYLLYLFFMMVCLLLVERFAAVFPFKWFFGAMIVVYLVGRWSYFLLRGDRRRLGDSLGALS
jgi:isoprenylcysteine carboxyl methyltransferase (ICMT) family protein YpbQ